MFIRSRHVAINVYACIKKKSTICYEHNNIITFDFTFSRKKKCDSLDSVYEHNNTINLYNDISSINLRINQNCTQI